MGASFTQMMNLSLNWGEWFKYDATSAEGLQDLMDQYGETAEKVINDVLHNEGEKAIETRINQLLPVSHRTFKGHRKGAKGSNPFVHDDDILGVTVAARGKWHYLYFPDDGSNTERHRGNQQFMKKGAENASSKIVDLCLGQLV